MFHKEGSSMGGGPHKKRSMDVPLKKSERRSLRNTAQTFFSHLEEQDGDSNSNTTNYKDILDATFLQGNLLQRKLTWQNTKMLLYNRHSTTTTITEQDNHNNNNNDSHYYWPYTSPQIVWIAMESSNRKDWIHAPTLALVSALCAVSSSSRKHTNICPTTVMVPSAVSKFMCRGAHLMRAGMRQILSQDADSTPSSDWNGIVAICVAGNPQPMAIGQLTSDTSMDTIGPNTKGIGVHIWTCYGDDLWRTTQLVLENTTKVEKSSPAIRRMNPMGGAAYNNGHYGNVGFLEGRYVSPLVALDESSEEESDSDTKEEENVHEQPKDAISNIATNNNNDDGATSTAKEEEPSPEQQDESTITTQTPNNNNDKDDDDDDDDDDSDSDDSSANPHDVVLEDAFGRACVSCSKSEFPMTTANFYAQHILKHATEPVQLKQTTYKKLSNFLRFKVQEGIVTVKADKCDPMAHVTSIHRGHVTLKSYRQEAAKNNKTSTKNNNNNKKKKMALVNLYRIPHHFVSLYHLDSDDVKATKAKSPERQGTGMLTAPEARAILEKYISAHNLVDTIMAPEDVKVDGPMCDTLYKTKKPHYPTEVSRKDLATTWLDHMEPAYALVEMPGSKITLLQKGKPPKVLVEVSMRSGRKFITRIRGLEVYGVNAEHFAKDVAKRFACSVSVDMEAADGRPALKKGCEEVTMQGNLAQELKALLLGDERLTSHGGAKDSDYCLPKNVISVTLKRGVPGKKK